MSAIASDPHRAGKAAMSQETGSTTKDFHHPYTPYAIQETFMGTVYQVLEEGKVGILESPTGTVSGHIKYHVTAHISGAASNNLTGGWTGEQSLM
jgi:hypothetical protein